jgi:hypothetical protein
MLDEREKRCAAGSFLHQGYQCGIAAVALSRHGTTRQLKGVIHECAFVLHHNANPRAVMRSGWAQLNPNSRDVVNDVLFTRAAGVQLKDTVSRSGASQTARRVPSYDGRVLGTPETVAAVGKHGVRIESSGISTAHNEAIAARAGTISWSALGYNAVGGIAIGAMCGGGLALLNGYLREEKREVIWDDVLRDAFVGGISGGIGAFGGTAAAALVPRGGTAILISMIVGVILAAIVAKYLTR